MSWENFCFFLCGAAMTLMLLIIWVSFIIPSVNKWNKRFFVSIFAIFLLCTVSMSAELFTYGNPSMILAEKVAVYFEYLLISIPMPMFTAYLLHTCGENWRKSKIFRLVMILWEIYFILRE